MTPTWSILSLLGTEYSRTIPIVARLGIQLVAYRARPSIIYSMRIPYYVIGAKRCERERNQRPGYHE